MMMILLVVLMRQLTLDQYETVINDVVGVFFSFIQKKRERRRDEARNEYLQTQYHIIEVTYILLPLSLFLSLSSVLLRVDRRRRRERSKI